MSSQLDPVTDTLHDEFHQRVAVHRTGDRTDDPALDTEAHLMNGGGRDDLDRLRQEWNAEPSHG
jgi:hypothetical protein